MRVCVCVCVCMHNHLFARDFDGSTMLWLCLSDATPPARSAAAQHVPAQPYLLAQRNCHSLPPFLVAVLPSRRRTIFA